MRGKRVERQENMLPSRERCLRSRSVEPLTSCRDGRNKYIQEGSKIKQGTCGAADCTHTRLREKMKKRTVPLLFIFHPLLVMLSALWQHQLCVSWRCCCRRRRRRPKIVFYSFSFLSTESSFYLRTHAASKCCQRLCPEDQDARPSLQHNRSVCGNMANGCCCHRTVTLKNGRCCQTCILNANVLTAATAISDKRVDKL